MSKLMKKMSLSELSFIVATDNYSTDLKIMAAITIFLWNMKKKL